MSSCPPIGGLFGTSELTFFDSPLADWSDTSLGAPTETADSFDFSDGVTGSVEPIDGEAVSRDDDAAVLIESVVDAECDIVLLLLPVRVGDF